MIGDHDPMCELSRQGSTGIRRGWVCSCKDYAAVRADEREKAVERVTGECLSMMHRYDGATGNPVLCFKCEAAVAAIKRGTDE